MAHFLNNLKSNIATRRINLKSANSNLEEEKSTNLITKNLESRINQN